MAGLGELATSVERLGGLGIDLTDLYVIALYKRVKTNDGGVSITSIMQEKQLVVSRSVVHRRLKKLVLSSVLLKKESDGDMRVKFLTDGPRMEEVLSMITFN